MKLKSLRIAAGSGVGNKGLSELTNIIELYASGNNKVTDINHLKNLKILHANGESCGITDLGISSLHNLIELSAIENIKITKII